MSEMLRPFEDGHVSLCSNSACFSPGVPHQLQDRLVEFRQMILETYLNGNFSTEGNGQLIYGKLTNAIGYLNILGMGGFSVDDDFAAQQVGSVPGWIGKCCHGEDEMKVYQELCQIVDEWIEIYRNDVRPLPSATAGKKYSGKFVLRTDPDLHQALAIRALNEGESLNNSVVKTLRRIVSDKGAVNK